MKKINKNVNLNKIERMSVAAFENALRLHEDSILLFNHKRYPSAYNLSVHSLEEIGKYWWLDDFLWHSRIEGRWDPKDEEEFLRSIYHHKAKQSMFSYANNPPDNSKEVFNFVRSGKAEKKKQDSMYVGLPRIKNKVNLHGKISIPLKKIKENHALKQISFINDYIICSIAGLMKGAYIIDIEGVEDILNYKLMHKLLKLWPNMSKASQRRYNYFMKHPDIEE